MGEADDNAGPLVQIDRRGGSHCRRRRATGIARTNSTAYDMCVVDCPGATNAEEQGRSGFVEALGICMRASVIPLVRSLLV